MKVNVDTEIVVYAPAPGTDEVDLDAAPAYEGRLGDAWRYLRVGEYSTILVDDTVTEDVLLEFAVYIIDDLYTLTRRGRVDIIAVTLGRAD